MIRVKVEVLRLMEDMQLDRMELRGHMWSGSSMETSARPVGR